MRTEYIRHSNDITVSFALCLFEFACKIALFPLLPSRSLTRDLFLAFVSYTCTHPNLLQSIFTCAGTHYFVFNDPPTILMICMSSSSGSPTRETNSMFPITSCFCLRLFSAVHLYSFLETTIIVQTII